MPVQNSLIGKHRVIGSVVPSNQLGHAFIRPRDGQEARRPLRTRDSDGARGDDDEMMISPGRRRREEADGPARGERGCEQSRGRGRGTAEAQITYIGASHARGQSKQKEHDPITRPNRLVHDQPISLTPLLFVRCS